MAERNEDLIFGMRLEVDQSQFKSGWDKIEPELQKIIDAKPLKVKLDINDVATNKIKAAVHKRAKETEEVVENSIKAIQREMKAMTGASENLDIFGDTKAIDALIQKSRDLKNTINEVKTAALPLKDILSIGGKTPTGLDLKRQKDELQRFISLEKEGSKDAIVANEKLIQVKERLRNMYGKQESALKATDEEKKVNETIAAYKRLSSELDKINARIRIRESIKSGSIIAPSSVSVSSMGTKTEAEMYNGISQAMDRYKTSLSAVNQEKLKATPVEASKSEIALGNQNLYIQTKIEEAAKRASAEQSKLWGRYGQALKGPENTIYQIEKKLEKIASIRTDFKMNPAQIKEADSAVSALKQKLDGLKNPLSATGQLANLNKQWAALSAQERKSAAGKDIIEKYRQIDKAAGGASGTLRNAALKTNQFSTALNKNAQELKSQRGLMNGMPQMMNSYISILGAYRLGKNIVDTTAEFEMQRVALAAIIQDKTKADELFAKDVELGLKSPFQIKELITATKQLSAFRIETDMLFDTTKRLADISAGLGVGMDRLILAYGQVKAASVLRGQELRQFTEAGIPLVEMLAQKFTKLRGELVTTGDVFKLISERGVSFGMVREIFEDMTNEGGVFFNMQEIQAETLRGKLSNLRDAYDKMFMEIGDSNSGPIKDAIDAFRGLLENWRAVGAVLSPAILTLVAYNVALKVSSSLTSKVTLLSTIYGKTIAGVTFQEQMLVKATALKAASQRSAAAATLLAGRANNILTRSFYLLRASMLANPVTFWATAITTAVAAIWGLIHSIRSARSESELLNENLSRSTSEINSTAKLSVINISSLVEKLKGATRGSEEYADIIKKINNIAGPHLKSNLDAADSYEVVARAAKTAASAIMEAAKAKAYEAGIQIIETDYSTRTGEQIERIQRGLTASGFTRMQASSLSQVLVDEIIKNPERYTKKADVVKLMYERIGKAASVAGVNIEDVFNTSILKDNRKILDGLQKIVDLQIEVKNTSEEFNASLKDSGETLSGYALAKKNINDTYQKEINYIKEHGYGFDWMGKKIDATTAKYNAEKKSLEDLIRAQIRYNQQAGIIDSKGKLDKLLSSGQEWATIVDNMTTGSGVMVEGTLGASGAKFARAQSETGSESYLDYVQRLQQEYDGLYKTQLQLAKNKNAKIPGVDKASIEADISAVKKLAEAIGWTLDDPNAKKTDTRIAQINEQVRATKEAYKEYAELTKWMSAEEAKKKTTEMYGGVDTSMFGLVFSDADLERVLREASVKMGDISKKDAQKIAMDASGVGFDVFKKAIKDKLDKLSRDIQQTQEANDFFESMLGLTGSEDAARRMTESLGLAVGDMRATLRQAFGDVMKTGGYTDDIDFKNIGGMQKMVNAIGPEEIRKAAQERLDAIIDYEKKEAKAVYDGLKEFMTAEQKKVIIIAETARKIKAIEAGPGDAVTKKANIDARIAKRDADLTAVDYEELKKLPSYVKAFEDLDRVGDKTLTLLREDLMALSKSTKDATALKTLMDQVQKIDELLEGRHPFASMVDGLNDYRHAVDLAAVALEFFGENSEEYAAAQDMIRASIDQTKKSIQRLKSDFDEASGAITSVIDLSKTLTDTLGLSFSDETNEYIDAFTGGIEIASSALSAMTAVTIALDAALAPLLIAAAAIGLMFVGITAATNAMNADTERDIKNNAKAIDALADSITKLNDALSDSVGSKYVKNVQAQIAANKEIIKLQQEQIKNNKDLSDTKSSGWWLLGGAAAYGIAWIAAKKKADEAKKSIKESEKEVAEREKEIAELERALMQETTGYSTVADAASAFADAWYEAYLSSENTFDLIGEKFKEMIDTMIVQSILAEAVAAKLAPVFDAIKAAYDNDGIMTPEELAGIQNMTADITVGMDADLRNLVTGLRRSGVDVNPTRKSLSGISASVSAMSEDTANTMGGYLNAGLRQWVLQTEFQGRIAVGVESMQKPLLDIYAMQGQSLAAINSIKSDTAIMVSKLTRMVDNQDATLNSGGQKAVNVRLIN